TAFCLRTVFLNPGVDGNTAARVCYGVRSEEQVKNITSCFAGKYSNVLNAELALSECRPH
ncbi:MAG TPA: hypothetical protein VN132_07815, partial [Bdellovibrio sp.]|nr:hypothetical protein [Bdellovibrio sp.]